MLSLKEQSNKKLNLRFENIFVLRLPRSSNRKMKLSVNIFNLTANTINEYLRQEFEVYCHSKSFDFRKFTSGF